MTEPRDRLGERLDAAFEHAARSAVPDQSPVPIYPATITSPSRWHRRRWLAPLVATAIAAAIALTTVAVTNSANSGSVAPTDRLTSTPVAISAPSSLLPTVTTSSPATASSPSPPAATGALVAPPAAVPTTVAVALATVVCPTAMGIDTTTAPPSLPATTSVRVPRALATSLALYTDSHGYVKLIAPVGWHCAATIDADGSSDVGVVPPGVSLPANQPEDWHLAGGSPVQAIVGSQTSACVGCTEWQACPVISSAAADYQHDYQRACAPAPAGEKHVPLEPGIVAFEDPPGVVGTGSPSGGLYAANGVVTYHSASHDGSWLDTCTLPPAQKSLCTLSLNTFIDWYGAR